MGRLGYRWAQWRHTRAKRGKDATPRLEEALAVIRPHLRVWPPCILSVGPRNHVELTILDRVGAVVDGVDLFPADPRIQRGDMERLAQPTGRYDLVFASHVLEHADDLAQAARELARVTRAGGLVWVAVPAGQPPTAHDRHRFDDEYQVQSLFWPATPEILFAETRQGRDVRILMRLRKDGPRRILYVLPDDFARRNVAGSGLLDRLMARGHSVERLEAGASAFGPPWRQWLRRGPLRTLCYLARARRGERTYAHKLQLRTSRRQRLEVEILRAFDWLFDGVRLAQMIERALPVWPAAAQALRDADPDVLVVHTSIYQGLENDLVKAAQRARIPVVAQVASWDNLTTKGDFLVRPDVLAVWGEASREQAIGRHGFRPEQVVVTGAPHMDVYGREPNEADQKVMILVERRPTILIVGTTLAYWNEEQGMVERIAAWAAARGIGVVYRPHPRRAGQVAVMETDYLAVDATGLSATPEHYRRLLARASCVVAAFSTMIIEAALMGKPSLIVAFGGSTGGTEYWVSDAGVHTVRGRLVQHEGFEHMAEVLTWPGIVTCRTETDLFDGLQRFAETPASGIGLSMREEFRRLTAAKLQHHAATVAHVLDGRAGERMAELIERVGR